MATRLFDSARHGRPAFLVGLLALVAPLAAPAQTAASGEGDYPAKTIRMVVAYPPGGGADILARMLAQRMTESLGQSVVVDNRAGATGILGTDMVAKAAPDGHTLLLITSDQTIVSSFPTRLPYDLLRDLEAVTQVSAQPYILCVPPSVPAQSLRELIALGKARPGQLNYASGGNGGTPHMAAELFKTSAGLDMVHVPYKGGGPALLAVVSGEVSMLFSSLPATLPHMKAGKVKALAVSSAKRSPVTPELPTVAESGIPGFDVNAWYGVMAPAKTPKAIVARLHREILKVLSVPDVRARMEKDGTEVLGTTPDQFADFLKGDIAKWTRVINATGTKLE